LNGQNAGNEIIIRALLQ